jgi:hypothetical protein
MVNLSPKNPIRLYIFDLHAVFLRRNSTCKSGRQKKAEARISYSAKRPGGWLEMAG